MLALHIYKVNWVPYTKKNQGNHDKFARRNKGSPCSGNHASRLETVKYYDETIGRKN